MNEFTQTENAVEDSNPINPVSMMLDPEMSVTIHIVEFVLGFHRN